MIESYIKLSPLVQETTRRGCSTQGTYWGATVKFR